MPIAKKSCRGATTSAITGRHTTCENASTTSTGSPCCEHYCMRGHSSCLHWKGKDLDYLRVSLIKSNLNLTYIVHCIHLSFSGGWELKTDLLERLQTKLDMGSIYMFERVTWFLFKTSIGQKKKFLKR